MADIAIKRGAALNLTLRFTQNDAPMDVGHVSLSAQVRKPDDTLVANLPMVKQADSGLVTSQVNDTTGWPVGRLRCDLRLVVNGQPIFSETFAIQVTRQVTQ